MLRLRNGPLSSLYKWESSPWQAYKLSRCSDKNNNNFILSSEWVVCGGGEGDCPDQTAAATHLHPNSPAPGAFWNNQLPLTFDRIKLTNNRSAVCHHQVHGV